jgi:NADH-quinone oxidoreductase subunit F
MRRLKGLTMRREINTEMKRSAFGAGGGLYNRRKWRTAAGNEAFPKYVACNGDEGTPALF